MNNFYEWPSGVGQDIVIPLGYNRNLCPGAMNHIGPNVNVVPIDLFHLYIQSNRSNVEGQVTKCLLLLLYLGFFKITTFDGNILFIFTLLRITILNSFLFYSVRICNYI